jgi:dTMP kinase
VSPQGTQRGHFISLEGGEGVGKSTQLHALAEALKGRGIDVVVTREPGGSDGAEKVRELLLSGHDERWSPEAEALLFAAARADHVAKTIRPALDAGRWVLSDRFADSSLAYQGGAGGLGIETVRAINVFAVGGDFPDRSLVLVLEEGGERAKARDNEGSDRIGGRSDDYHRKVDTAFRIIAAEEPERVKLIEASGPPEEVTQRLLDAIADLLP